MTNNNDEDIHRWSRTTTPSLPISPPLFSSENKGALHRRRRAPPRDVAQHEPWLFQSNTMQPLVVLPPSLSLSEGETSLFYLDVDSLKSLLPLPDGRRRVKSSKNLDNSSRGTNGPPSRGQIALPPRLEPLSFQHLSHKKHWARKRRQKLGLASMQTLRRKGSRFGPAMVRPATEEVRDDDSAALQSTLTKRLKKKTRTEVLSFSDKRRVGTRRRRANHFVLDDDAEDHEQPVSLLQSTDEEQRQKAMIATQLDLTLSEYEHLDAAFGKNVSSLASEDEGSLTERYFQEFQEFDVDHSGTISPDELRQLLLASGKDMDDTELASVIQQADTDHDGEIDFQEFIALMRARKRLLQVANLMGATGSGPPSTNLTTTTPLRNTGHSLPPLKLAPRHLKRHRVPQNPALVAARSTPSCLRPGATVDISELRRELALSEVGIQELNSKVREGLHWVQQHCPVRSLKTQIFCHRWGMEKVNQLLMRLQLQQLSRGFRKWHTFLVFERNKIKANMYFKCKGSQKMTTIMNKWRRKVTRRKVVQWKTVCSVDRRNELLSAAIEIQRIVRGALARGVYNRLRQGIAALRIQTLVRGHLARRLARRKRQDKINYEAACLLQRSYRGYTGKRLAQALYKAQRETRAAGRIQRTYKNYKQRELLRVFQQAKVENASALVLQCCMRSYLARQERKRRATRRVQRRRARLLLKCIQDILARRRVILFRKQTRAALTIQCFVRVCRSRHQVHLLRIEKQRQEQQARKVTAALRIQTCGRKYLARKQYLLKKHQRALIRALENLRRFTSAVVIQSLLRGYVTRCRIQRARRETLLLIELRRLNSSAVKIQALWRGYHSRVAWSLRLEAQKAQAQRHQENEAAKRLQAIARGRIARKKRVGLEQERDRRALQQRMQVEAALCIQKVVRGNQARRAVQKLRREYQNEARLARERLILETKTRAAVKIQSHTRRYLVRRQHVIQTRGVEHRKQLEALQMQQNDGAKAIQSAFRHVRARRALREQRLEFEKRISRMISEKAHKEIERLRKEQEEELAKLKKQLLDQTITATNEATKLREEFARRCALEDARRIEEAHELTRLRQEARMHRHELDTRVEAQHLLERLEEDKHAEQDAKVFMRTQEIEDVATFKVETMVMTEKEEMEDQSWQLEAEHTKQADLQLHKGWARMKIQGVCLRYVGRTRIKKLQEMQVIAMTKIRDEELRVRLRAEQQKEVACAESKPFMDEEACGREQEVKELEIQMLERARMENERLALRNTSARVIQAWTRGCFARKRLQRKIDMGREDRAKALQETQATESPRETNDQEHHAADDSEETKTDEWVEYWDDSAQASYYYNIRTQEASWTRPLSTLFPSAMETVEEADDRRQNAIAEYVDFTAANHVDANDDSTAEDSAEGYADEHGYYDQLGQYHFHEQNNAPFFNLAAHGQMQPNYAAAAAANYAYQTVAAMAYGQSMMYGAPEMRYGHPSMAHRYIRAAVVDQPAETAVPPDPWEKFYDQYTGAAYYYNNTTGEQYWA